MTLESLIEILKETQKATEDELMVEMASDAEGNDFRRIDEVTVDVKNGIVTIWPV